MGWALETGAGPESREDLAGNGGVLYVQPETGAGGAWVGCVRQAAGRQKSRRRREKKHVQHDLEHSLPLQTSLQDFTLQVQQKHRSFDEVKKILYSKDIKYMMIFSARLRVVLEDGSWFFNTPAEAWKWMEGWCTPGRRVSKGPKKSRGGVSKDTRTLEQHLKVGLALEGAQASLETLS
ncbi:hypothetical protein NDU88_003119 [Pleurodeles waltl]|uniref:Uncharacterized protein n=1 Tax=Pleurodeles waltl TaxID=8319 RepID=A0AAV7WRH4_PLEWA|nr:hypothetical protein NDU88_003119 [Pleurodeles waltl]